jgi:hypothetical protein
VADKHVLHEYFFASVIVSLGLVLDYICAIVFGGWLANSNPLTLIAAIVCGSFSVFLIMLGLTGFLMDYGRELCVLEDRIIVPSDYKFDSSRTEIPLGRIWRFYSNLKNDFPAMFLVWKDDKDQCRCTLVDKEEVRDLQALIARLGERVPVDTDSYAVADSVKNDVRAKLGCEPAW